MFCDKCGCLSIGRKTCASCSEQTNSRARGRVATTFRGKVERMLQDVRESGSATVKIECKAVKIVVDKTGKAVQSNLGSQEVAELLGRELELPEAARALLETASANAEHISSPTVEAAQTTAATTAGQNSHRVRLVSCPQCHHSIAPSDWCVYCGYEFSKSVDNSVNNTVDRQFLDEPIKVEERQKPQSQELRDSYAERLKRL